ncbi:MAG: lipopolysaccharide heptosyltransferase II [Armatimonadota bacterium]
MRIVCFHLNQIGDLVFSLPALKCLRDSFPNAYIASVVRPPVRDLLQCTDLVNEVLVRSGGLNLRKIELARRLAAGKFDLAVLFSQSAECAILAFLSRAPRRVGFVNTSFGRLLTDLVQFRHPPSTENNLRLVRAVGCPISKSDYVGLLTPSQAMMESGRHILDEHGVGSDERIIALAPGTSGRRRLKEWSESGFARVAKHAVAGAMKVVIIGTDPAPGIVQDSREIIDLAGKTTLSDVVGILARCAALVGVDSGILHLCAALGKPVVGLYGPSDPATTGPQGKGHVVLFSGAECSPCAQVKCSFGRKCMTNIDPADVIAALDAVLEGNDGSQRLRDNAK